MRTYNKGFIFIDGELKTFNPLKWQIRFSPQEECMCTCEIGVGDSKEVRTIDIAQYDVYTTEAGFKSGLVADGFVRQFCDLFYTVFHFYPLADNGGEPYAFEFRDGEAKHTDVSNMEFCIDDHKVTCNHTTPLYKSHEDVYNHNDYTVDGELRVSPKSKLALNAEQRKYLEQFKESLKMLKATNVRMVYEADNGWLYFANGDNVESFDYYEPRDGFIEVADFVECVTNFGASYMNFNNCESLYAKLK